MMLNNINNNIAPSLAVFKRNLKTRLFRQSYSSHWRRAFYCFYFVCAVPLKLSGLRHVNLDVYNNNNNNNTRLAGYWVTDFWANMLLG